ncbi:hypothetical protein DFJ58DRAFT_771767 [Suillus subalutaceus]|uniref:uncharacterized protein n=1 Tax=Suillus subalutaceus TaxID=48586 RepID=UPI001B8842B7|nr:uncharacterized protein DFJ58DRAFT_771767 [Suillus subalutaceus]KAG1857838.1 hypothetical protein F4604DRAFT_1795615 [Suillus subluteus]KAG1864960.1 hypothetical protein DFJ58DRAFT_771767 [Suillus subalutaceus]
MTRIPNYTNDSAPTTFAHPQNFIVFGEMGVGKSSLINLIAGEQVAKSSSGVQSCNLESTEYPIRLSDPQLNVNLFDTVGLDSPTMDSASYLNALVKAHELIVSLKNQGGVHGLIFCIKGGRVSRTMQQNYRLFYEFLCQKKVPLALVVTNLETEVNMDDWWTRNKVHVEKSGVVPATHVCITAIKGHQNAHENKYFESRRKVHNMLRVLGRAEPYSIDTSSWFGRMCRLLPELLLTAKTLGRSRQKMLQMLTKRCELRKEDAVQLLQRIDSSQDKY